MLQSKCIRRYKLTELLAIKRLFIEYILIAHHRPISSTNLKQHFELHY